MSTNMTGFRVVFKLFCILVHCTSVALALEGLSLLFLSVDVWVRDTITDIKCGK